MSGTPPATAGNSPATTAKGKPMSAVVEARHLISEVAGPMQAGVQIQEMLTAVARKTGLGARRLRGIWNNEARAIRAEELDALRAAASRRREEQEAQDRHEYRTLVERITFLENRMAEIDPSFHSSAPTAAVAPERSAGRQGRTMVGGR